MTVKAHNETFYKVDNLSNNIYITIMLLEKAYKEDNKGCIHTNLLHFYNYKELFIKQVETSNFSLHEKFKLYNNMWKVCLTITQHQKGFYHLTPIIIKTTQHYLTILLEKIQELVISINNPEQIQKILEEQRVALYQITKLRHLYNTIMSGVDIAKTHLEKQIKILEGKLK